MKVTTVICSAFLVAGCQAPPQGSSGDPALGVTAATTDGVARIVSPPFDIGSAIPRTQLTFRAENGGYVGRHTSYRVRVEQGGAWSFSPGGSIGLHSKAVASPLRLETLTVGVAGRRTGAARTHVDVDGSMAIERDLAVESLRSTDRGVEQSWRFAERPASKGDLVVEVGVAGQDYSSSTSSGLHFVDKASGLGARYGTATWVDGAGTRTTIQPTFSNGQISLVVPAALVKSSSFPAVLDPEVGAELAVDVPPGGDVERSATVATNGTVWLVTWLDSRVGGGKLQVWGIVLNLDGTPHNGMSSFAISGAFSQPANGRSVWSPSASAFITTYVNDVQQAGGGFVMGAKIDTNGTVSLANTQLTALSDVADSDLAIDDAGGLMTVYTNGFTTTQQVFFTMFDSTLTPIGGKQDVEIATPNTPPPPGNPPFIVAPCIAFDSTNNQNFLVTFIEPGASSFDIFGQRIKKDGTILDGAHGFAVSDEGHNQTQHWLGFDRGSFFEVFIDPRNGHQDLFGERINPTTGALLDGASNVNKLIFSNGNDKLFPFVQADGALGYVVGFTDMGGGGSLALVRVKTDFSSVDGSETTVSSDIQTNFPAAGASDRAGHTLFVHEKGTTSTAVGNLFFDIPNGSSCTGDATKCASGICAPDGNCCPVACNPPNTVTSCSTGACVFTACANSGGKPTYDCDGNPLDVNGCETATSVTSCSGCAMACDTLNSNPVACTGATTAAALCTYTCKGGFSDCDVTNHDLNGCETSNTTNLNCGGCGALCNAADVCHTGACGPDLSGNGVCRQTNTSACGTPYCALAGLGITPMPDPNFGACSGSGAWKDTDGDGLSDAEETLGYVDLNCNGIKDAADIDLTLDGTPTVAGVDFFVHYDYVDAGAHNHNPPASAITLLRNAFAAQGVTLHIDPTHHAIAEATAKVVSVIPSPGNVPVPGCAGPSAKSPFQLRGLFPDVALEKPVYHYLVFGHWSSCDSIGHCGTCAVDPECGNGQPPQFGALGSAEIGGNDAIVSLGPYTDSATPIPDETWAGLALHELGHNLGLFHGGPVCDNFKPNYLSVMNYNFYTTGIPVAAAAGDGAAKACLIDTDCQGACVTAAQCQNGASCVGGHCNDAHCSSASKLCYRIDLSNFKYNDLNEFAPNASTGGLDETVGLTGNPTSRDVAEWSLDGFTPLYAPTNATHIDWNQDTTYAAHVDQDLNFDGATTTLAASNDWVKLGGVFTNLNFDFQCSTHYADAGTMVAASQEPTFDDLKARHHLYLPQEVSIDIRPGCGSNWIVLGSPLTVPVVLYGSATVDVSQIDPATLQLAGGAPLGVLSADVNGDGFGDLSMTFVMASLTQLTAISSSARLTGAKFNSQAIFGTDVVTIVPFAGPVVVIHNDGTGFAYTFSHQLNHTMETYSLSDCADSVIDRCGGVLNPNTAGNILRVTSDEADGCAGSGSAIDDIAINSSSSFSVRRERDGFGNGRVYTVTFTETDSSGNVTQSQCRIQVPHDANGPNAIDSGVQACVGTGC